MNKEFCLECEGEVEVQHFNEKHGVCNICFNNFYDEEWMGREVEAIRAEMREYGTLI